MALLSTKTYNPLIYPALLARVLKALAACEARGAVYWLTSGLRDHAEQDALYAIGRTTGTKGSFVTRARGGQSYHNFGLAVDVCLDGSPRDGLQPAWGSQDYRVWGEEAQRAGLEWGGAWRGFIDVPHVQWPGVGLPALQREYARGGLPAVWRWLDGGAP